MTPKERKAVVRRYAEEVCSYAGNLDVADEIVGASWGSGPDGRKKTYADIRIAFPDVRREVIDVVVGGDKVVLYSTYTGTHRGASEQYPFPPTNVQINMPGVAVFVVRDGKIVDELWSCHNMERDLMYPLAKATARRWFEEGWSKGIEEAHAMIDELFAPDVVLYGPPFPPTKGAAAYKQDVSLFKTAFPDLRFTLESVMNFSHWLSCRYDT